MIMSIQKPNKFHIEEATLIIKHESNTFEIQLEIRELMKICRTLEKRGQYKVSEKIKKFLNSYARCYGIKNFKHTDNISIAKIGGLNYE